MLNALGNPIRLLLTPGQASEYGQVEALVEGFACEAALAEMGYGSDAFVEVIQRRGTEAIIPSKKSRLNPRNLDRHLYKACNLVERFFQKLKQFRRIATRYDRLARNYQSMVSLVSDVIWLA